MKSLKSIFKIAGAVMAVIGTVLVILSLVAYALHVGYHLKRGGYLP